MSKQSGKSLKQVRTDRAQPSLPLPFVMLIMRRILGWSRLVRILLVTFFALIVTAAVFPLSDSIYIANFYLDETRILPSFVSAAFGIIMYVVGWWLLVGTRGETPPVRPAAVVYVVFGTLFTLFVLVLILNGYSTATLPDV